MSALVYPRILLKLSGESLGEIAIEKARLEAFARYLFDISQTGVQMGVVIGGGNWLRGRESDFMDRVVADQLGMHATVMNALAVSSAIRVMGGNVEVMSAEASSSSAGCVVFDFVRARMLLSQGVMLIFAGGTGNPLFSTDSAAALRAIQIQADILLKATKHDGVYDKDPAQCDDATMYEHISYEEILSQRLAVMDLTAFDLCQQHGLPIRVFNMLQENAVINIIRGEKIGTLIH